MLSPNSRLNESNSIRLALTPIKKPKPNKPFSVSDIESRRWIEFLVIGHYDGAATHYFYSLSEYLDFIFEHPHDSIFFHFGGIFDFLFILGEVFKSDKYKLESIIPRGSSLLSATLTNGKRSITLRDSSALLPFALKTLAKNFNCDTQKGEIDYAKIEKVTPELLEYLKKDLWALFEILEQFYASEIIKSVGAKFTIASQSIQVLRKYISNPIPSCPQPIDDFVRQSYAGGRTEIFRPIFDGIATNERLRNYDINSLYPYVMQGNEFPTKFEEWSKELDLERCGFHEVLVQVPIETYLPILWIKNPKFVFPVGTFWGVYSSPELRHAQAHGARILRHKKSAYFTSGGNLFSEFVRDLYSKRLTSKSDVDKTIIKLILNSTYGRMGLNLEREGLELDYGQEGVTPHFELSIGEKTVRFVKKPVQLKSFSNPAIASYVTAYARIENWKYLSKFENSIHYTDTDSFFTTDQHATSKELGELKLEYEMERACFILPKTYIAGEKIAMKGFDRKKIQHFKFEDFQLALEGELKMLRIETDERMSRFKTAMRKGKVLHLSGKSVKQIQSMYDKRILFRERSGNWNSRPIQILEK